MGKVYTSAELKTIRIAVLTVLSGLRFNLRKAKFYAGVRLTENISETSFVLSNTEFKF